MRPECSSALLCSLVLTSVGNGRRVLVAKRYTMFICKGKLVEEYYVREEKSNIKMLVRTESKFSGVHPRGGLRQEHM